MELGSARRHAALPLSTPLDDIPTKREKTKTNTKTGDGSGSIPSSYLCTYLLLRSLAESELRPRRREKEKGLEGKAKNKAEYSG